MQLETVKITSIRDCKYYLNTGLYLNQTLNTTSETLTYMYFLNF